MEDFDRIAIDTRFGAIERRLEVETVLTGNRRLTAREQSAKPKPGRAAMRPGGKGAPRA